MNADLRRVALLLCGGACAIAPATGCMSSNSGWNPLAWNSESKSLADKSGNYPEPPSIAATPNAVSTPALNKGKTGTGPAISIGQESPSAQVATLPSGVKAPGADYGGTKQISYDDSAAPQNTGSGATAGTGSAQNGFYSPEYPGAARSSTAAQSNPYAAQGYPGTTSAGSYPSAGAGAASGGYAQEPAPVTEMAPPSRTAGGYPSSSGYPAATGGYPSSGYPTGGYPAAGGYPSSNAYPGAVGGYPATSGAAASGYPASTGAAAGGYPASASGYPASTGGYPASTGGYPSGSASGGYPASSSAYPATSGGYAPSGTAPATNPYSTNAPAAPASGGYPSTGTSGAASGYPSSGSYPASPSSSGYPASSTSGYPTSSATSPSSAVAPASATSDAWAPGSTGRTGLSLERLEAGKPSASTASSVPSANPYGYETSYPAATTPGVYAAPTTNSYAPTSGPVAKTAALPTGTSANRSTDFEPAGGTYSPASSSGYGAAGGYAPSGYSSPPASSGPNYQEAPSGFNLQY